MTEAEILVDKVTRYQAWVESRNPVTAEVGGIYLSANGFDDEVERWLHSQGVLTTDVDTWGIE